jgi:hypothetical protein
MPTVPTDSVPTDRQVRAQVYKIGSVVIQAPLHVFDVHVDPGQTTYPTGVTTMSPLLSRRAAEVASAIRELYAVKPA